MSVGVWIRGRVNGGIEGCLYSERMSRCAKHAENSEVMHAHIRTYTTNTQDLERLSRDMLVEQYAGNKTYLYKSQYEVMMGPDASPTFDELAVPWASEQPARIVLDAMACLVMGVCVVDNLEAFARQMNLHLSDAFRKSGDIEGVDAILGSLSLGLPRKRDRR